MKNKNISLLYTFGLLSVDHHESELSQFNSKLYKKVDVSDNEFISLAKAGMKVRIGRTKYTIPAVLFQEWQYERFVSRLYIEIFDPEYEPISWIT